MSIYTLTADRLAMPKSLTFAALAGVLTLATARADSGLYPRAEVGASLVQAHFSLENA